MKTQLRKVGNSIGSIIPAAIIRELHLDVGADVELKVQDGSIIMTPVKSALLPYSEAELLQGLDAHNAHADEVAVVSDSEWLPE